MSYVIYKINFQYAEKISLPELDSKTFSGVWPLFFNLRAETNNFYPTYMLLSSLVSKIAYRKHLHRDSNSGSFLGSWPLFLQILLPEQTNLVFSIFFTIIIFQGAENIFTGAETPNSFSGMWYSFLKSPTDTNNFGLICILLSLVPRIQKISSLELRPGEVWGGGGFVPVRPSFLLSRHQNKQIWYYLSSSIISSS